VWDRAFWVMLSRRWKGWKGALAIVEPATVVWPRHRAVRACDPWRRGEARARARPSLRGPQRQRGSCGHLARPPRRVLPGRARDAVVAIPGAGVVIAPRVRTFQGSGAGGAAT
jgi:hypothetical protein